MKVTAFLKGSEPVIYVFDIYVNKTTVWVQSLHLPFFFSLAPVPPRALLSRLSPRPQRRQPPPLPNQPLNVVLSINLITST